MGRRWCGFEIRFDQQKSPNCVQVIVLARRVQGILFFITPFRLFVGSVQVQYSEKIPQDLASGWVVQPKRTPRAKTDVGLLLIFMTSPTNDETFSLFSKILASHKTHNPRQVEEADHGRGDGSSSTNTCWMRRTGFIATLCRSVGDRGIQRFSHKPGWSSSRSSDSPSRFSTVQGRCCSTNNSTIRIIQNENSAVRNVEPGRGY